MPGPRKLLALAAVAAAALILPACGTEKVEVAKSDPTHRGAELFAQRCGGCHTLKVAGTQGSATKKNDRERIDGPNFDQRKEQVDEVLYAIRNGGFSGALMPQNIVTGAEARQVAEFLAKYSGRDRSSPKSPSNTSSSSG
jgi:mono/diheme cytochrome c family protein